MIELAKKLNASRWKGVVSETGIGMGFSHEYTLIPGASNTILHVINDYAGINKPTKDRAVSLTEALRQAHRNYSIATNCRTYCGTEEPFGLSITGAHYEDRAGHVWVAIVTTDWEAYVHFAISSTRRRDLASKIYIERVVWFLMGCLVPNDTWINHIRAIKSSLEIDEIDVLYGPGISDVERLHLLGSYNPLAYRNGEFVRVVDLLRDADRICPGSFNPPHFMHKEIGGEDAVYELSQLNAYKGGISMEDLLHRIRMMNLMDMPVIITHAPLFVNKHTLFRELHEREYVYRMGSDAWNAFIAAHQYPSHEWLAERMSNAIFEVKLRPGDTVEQNGVSKHLDWCIYEEQEKPHSSTAIRAGDTLEYTDNRVLQYIAAHQLYV